MGYLKYIAKDAACFFGHAAKALGVGLALLLAVWVISPFDDAPRIFVLAMLEGAASVLLIWLLYMIVDYPRYRRLNK